MNTRATSHPTATPKTRDGWVMAGMTVAAASAAVASFSGLRGLAQSADCPPGLSWLLPLTVDAYAMTSARVWLGAATRTRRARRFASANAVGAITASIAGNAAYHALATGLLTVSWPIVVLVGAVPAAVLGLTAHLHALRTLTDPEQADSEPAHAKQSRPESGPGFRPESRTRTTPRRRTRVRPRTEDELMAAAREADATYRTEHDGRPITRDALRTDLRIAGPRATELRRRLAAEKTDPDEPTDDTDRKEAPSTR